jgi:hypothetical protein
MSLIYFVKGGAGLQLLQIKTTPQQEQRRKMLPGIGGGAGVFPDVARV